MQLIDTQNGGFPAKTQTAIVSGMVDDDVDRLIAGNLRRIRNKKELSQLDVARLVGMDKAKISAYENAHAVMGKDVMVRFCKALEVDLWEFYWTEKTPIVRDAREMADIEQRREAEKVGIADMVREAEASWIVAAKKKSGALREDAAARDKRTRKRAG